MTITLYNLASEYRAQLETLADLDLPEEVVQDTLESLGGELELKTQSVIGFSRHLEKLAESIKSAEAEMAQRRKIIEARVDRMKHYVLEAMLNNNIQKIECPYFVVGVAKNPPSVDVFDEATIPQDYFVEQPAPPPRLDKKLVMKAIKDGFEVPGCRLNQSVRLSIK